MLVGNTEIRGIVYIERTMPLPQADSVAIEVKASKTMRNQDLKTLQALSEEKKLKNYILVCLEEQVRRVGVIQVLPWKIFLERLWEGNFSGLNF